MKMTSKEALDRLYTIACVQPGPVKEQFITYEKEIKHNKTIEDLYNIIKQDLNKSMQLKKIVTDFINWLDSESTRDWYQYGDLYEHLVYKVEELE